MERGDFYASTGVELSDYEVTSSRMVVTVEKESSAKSRIQFIGRGGAVLHEALDSPATSSSAATKATFAPGSWKATAASPGGNPKKLKLNPELQNPEPGTQNLEPRT